MKFLFDYLKPAESKFNGEVKYTIDFVSEKQLKVNSLWKKFANEFIARLDPSDKGWRGEYWGKMMRGGCLTYMFSGDPELYDSLTFAVNELLKTQDDLGRISTYTVETEFNGWDMWCRKYVLSGLEHYYKICKDLDLKQRVLKTMISTADYICEHIGEGKIEITKTSNLWHGVNSCSILETFVELYNLTNNQKYLDFAKYIISTGGCDNGNLIECVEKENCYPFEYPTVKAYEIMSFFEGLLAYYEVSKDIRYLNAVQKFVEDAYFSDRTVIGGLSGKGELFDNFYPRQTEYMDGIVQETCVTVTLIRLLSRLYFNVGDSKYIDRIEFSGFNALWGSLNTEWNTHYSSVVKKQVAPLPFDSYSPLAYDKRGKEVGGFKIMQDGTNYGCCACIGAAGFALIPLLAVLRNEKGFVINFYFNGEIKTKTPLGSNVKITIQSNYPADSKVKIKIDTQSKEKFTIKFRKPNWCNEITFKGADFIEENNYFVIEKVWENDQIELDLLSELKTEKLNGKVAFIYGPLVLARDDFKEQVNGDLDVIGFNVDDNNFIAKKMPAEKGESVRFVITDVKGENSMILTNYSSCGKHWDKNNKISVWLK